jgi:sugar/nucleoside kinase (ribokinase family)
MIVTIGEVLVEIMAVDAGEGFREPIRLVGPFPSGAPAIFIDQVGKLGHPCGMVSCVGADDFGRVNLDRLRADGVDVSAIRVHPEAVTGSAFVRYRPDGQRDFVFNIRHSACGGVELDAAALALLDRADHLHVMGSSLFSPAMVEANEAAIARVKARGGTVSFDPNVRKEMMRQPGMRAALERVLAGADLFLPSGPELLLFTKAQAEREAIRELLGRGLRAVVLKRGAAGASYHGAEGDLSVAGLPVDEIDPTGAGDCFGATFVTCWLEGMGPAEALRQANASGALAVGRKGPMEGASTRAEIAALLARLGASGPATDPASHS